MVNRPRGNLDKQRITAGQQRIDPLRRQQRRANTKPRKQLPTRGAGTPARAGGQQVPKVRQQPTLAERMGETAKGVPQQRPPMQAGGVPPSRLVGPSSNLPSLDSLPKGARDIIHAAIIAQGFIEGWDL